MLHTLLDAARMGSSMARAKEMNEGSSSLYKGRSEEQLADFAPYLFLVTGKKTFADWLTTQGWGQSWGVYLESSAKPAEVYRHFRKFLIVRDERGKEFYFRFYDPRVLRQFLPTCNNHQLTDFFGPIRYFLIEDEDPTFALRIWLDTGTLRQQRMSRAEAEQTILC